MYYFIKSVLYEAFFYTDLIKNFCLQMYYNPNMKDILYNTFCAHFNYNNFRIVNSSIGKYISVCDKDTNTYNISLNFGSYDYMGMTNIIENRDKLVSLYEKYNINSDPKLISKLEDTITKFLNRDDTIVINGGYQANSIYLPLILEDYTLVLSDVDNHASIIKGLQFLRKQIKAKIIIFKTLDDLEKKLLDYKTEKIIVIVEGIYSMKGSILELDKYILLKEIYKFHLYIDEAHSAGCIGDKQGGICDYYNIKSNNVEFLMGTFSKTFNAHGSYISGPSAIIQKLKNFRDINEYNIFPVVSIQHIISVYDYLEKNHENITSKFTQIIKYAYNSIKKNTYFNIISNPNSPIICLQTTYGRLTYTSKYFIKNKIACVMVGYPAVKLPHCIIRICLSQSHTFDDIDYLVSCLNIDADYSKLHLPDKETIQIIDTSYINSNKVIDTIRKSSIGTAGPSGFYGYLSMTVILEKIIGNITNKNTCLCLPHAISGYSDIFDNLVNRHKYTYICVESNINKKILDTIKRSKCKVIFESELRHTNSSDKILYVDIIPDSNKHDCLKIMTDVNFTYFDSYKYVIGSFESLCTSLGCFLAYNSNDMFIPSRTAHSSYVFSATLPSYIIHHNIVKILEQRMDTQG